MGVLGKKGVGRFPVYGELRLLHRQFAMSTKKAPINIKRGAIAEAELAIIQVMDSVSFASESASPVERLTLIRDALRTLRFVEIRVRTLRDLGFIPEKGYAAIMLHEDSTARQLTGWLKKVEKESE